MEKFYLIIILRGHGCGLDLRVLVSNMHMYLSLDNVMMLYTRLFSLICIHNYSF